MLCSIFMASTTQTSWSAETDSPGRTVMASTFPGIGERMTLSELVTADGAATGCGAAGCAGWAGNGARVGAGATAVGVRPSISTWYRRSIHQGCYRRGRQAVHLDVEPSFPHFYSYRSRRQCAAPRTPMRGLLVFPFSPDAPKTAWSVCRRPASISVKRPDVRSTPGPTAHPR